MDSHINEAQDESITAESLRRLFNSCKVCGALSEHSYALIATTVYSAEQKADVLRFFKTLEAQRWQNLLNFKEWDPLSNNIEVYAIRCKSGRIAVLTVHSPYEVYEYDSVISYEPLSVKSGQELASLIKHDMWKPLNP